MSNYEFFTPATGIWADLDTLNLQLTDSPTLQIRPSFVPGYYIRTGGKPTVNTGPIEFFTQPPAQPGQWAGPIIFTVPTGAITQ